MHAHGSFFSFFACVRANVQVAGFVPTEIGTTACKSLCRSYKSYMTMSHRVFNAWGHRRGSVVCAAVQSSFLPSFVLRCARRSTSRQHFYFHRTLPQTSREQLHLQTTLAACAVSTIWFSRSTRAVPWIPAGTLARALEASSRCHRLACGSVTWAPFASTAFKGI